MGDAIVVTGRTFRPVDPDALTARRDDWIQVRVLEAGLDALPAMLAAGEDPAREILLRALKAGAKPLLLAGMFDEIGPDGEVIAWTEARAAATAEFFACLTAAADRQAVNGAFLGVLVGFFRGALGSSGGSRTSSSGPSAHDSRSAAPSPASPPNAAPAPASSSSRSSASGARPKSARRRGPTG